MTLPKSMSPRVNATDRRVSHHDQSNQLYRVIPDLRIVCWPIWCAGIHPQPAALGLPGRERGSQKVANLPFAIG